MAEGAWLVFALAMSLGSFGCRDRTPGRTDTTSPPVTIHCRAPLVGDRWRIVKTMTATARNEHEGGATSVRMESDEERTERVLAVENGVVTRLEVSFAVHSRRTINRDLPETRSVSPVVGKTYVFTRTAEGGVVITEAGLPVRAEELPDVQQTQVEFGSPLPHLPALCEKTFAPGESLVDEGHVQAAARKRAEAQAGDGVRLGEFTMRYVRRDRGAAIFSAVTRVTAPAGSSDLRYDAWVRPSDGAFTRTETETTSAFSSGPVGMQAKVTMNAFIVEMRDGPTREAP